MKIINYYYKTLISVLIKKKLQELVHYAEIIILTSI
jgi:hypothetical protein